MAPHSSTLDWKIPWAEEPGRLQSMGSLRVGHDWVTSLSLSLSCIGEGNGNPLQCSCLENPRDRVSWWAAIYGVTQSWTRLKRLNSSSSRDHLRLWIMSSSPERIYPYFWHAASLGANHLNAGTDWALFFVEVNLTHYEVLRGKEERLKFWDITLFCKSWVPIFPNPMTQIKISAQILNYCIFSLCHSFSISNCFREGAFANVSFIALGFLSLRNLQSLKFLLVFVTLF